MSAAHEARRLVAVTRSKLDTAQREGRIRGWEHKGRTTTIYPLSGPVIKCHTLTSIESNLDSLAEKAKATA